MRRLLFTLILAINLFQPLFAQQRGKAFVKNFSPGEYQAGAQNWSVVQDYLGIIYIANSEGILRFDGENWTLLQIDKDVPRVLICSEDKRTIYVGTENDFGFLSPVDGGSIEFVSQKHLLPSNIQSVTGISNAFLYKEGVVFQTNHLNVFLEDDTTHVILEAKENHIKIQENHYLLTSEGYKRLEDDLSLTFTELTPALDPTRSDVFIPVAGSHYLTIGQKSGDLSWYDYHINRYISISNANKEETKKALITSGTKIAPGLIALATLKEGVWIIDASGNILQKINKENGLINNEVFSVFVDDQKGIWAATRNGVSRIEENDQITYWDEDMGLNLGVVTSLVHTSQGLIAGGLGVAILGEDGVFKMLDGVSDKVNDLEVANHQASEFIVASETKLLYYSFANNKWSHKVLEETPAHAYKRVLFSKKYPRRFYAATESSIEIFERSKNGDIWKKKEEVITEIFPCSILEDRLGQLWIGGTYDQVSRISFAGDHTDIFRLTNFTEKEGLPSGGMYRLSNQQDKILVGTTDGIYTFNTSKKVFEPLNEYNNLLPENHMSIYHMIARNTGSLLVASYKNKGDQIGEITYNRDNERNEWEGLSFKRLPVMEIEDIMMVADTALWLASSEGVIRFNIVKTPNYDVPFVTIIDKVVLNNDSIIFSGNYRDVDNLGHLLDVQLDQNIAALAYNDNDLSFYFASPYFNGDRDNVYRYKLSGFDQDWSEWQSISKKEYTNLPIGEYTFRVKSQNIYGQESDEGTYSFVILPPWYISVWALVGYVIAFGLFIWGILALYSIRADRKANKLAMLVDQKKAEILEKEEALAVKDKEIDHQKNNVAVQRKLIEQVYEDIEAVSKMGQMVSSSKGMEEIVSVIYKNINKLTDATTFGIGIYNEKFSRIDYSGTIVGGKKVEFFFDTFDEVNKFSVYCVKHKQKIIIGDYDTEKQDYITGDNPFLTGEKMNSLMYVPLAVGEDILGVLTVQSPHKNTYTRIHQTFIEALASYVAISLSNVEAKKTIHEFDDTRKDSIHYAVTVQNAVLPSIQRLNEAFYEYFVYYEPKDVVSGDFYWCSQKEDKIYLAVVDCTGHGIPGAFMTMIGITLLNEIVNVAQIFTPAEILKRLHRDLAVALKKDLTTNDDGMDLGICLIEPGDDMVSKIQFAGAKASLYYTSNQELVEVKGDRKSIGGLHQQSNKFQFTNHEISLNLGDSIYLFSDGYIDQQSSNRRKFGSKRFKELISEVKDQPMTEQKVVLEKAITDYRMFEEQRDDITVIGVKI